MAQSNEEKHFDALHDASYALNTALVAKKPADVVEALRVQLDAALNRYWAAVEEERASRRDEGPDCMSAAHEASL